jgi:hypothetical protein
MRVKGKKLLFRCVRLVKVSSEAKMVLTTMAIFISLISLLYVFQHYKCGVVGYQDLSGSHSESVCKWEK